MSNGTLLEREESISETDPLPKGTGPAQTAWIQGEKESGVVYKVPAGNKQVDLKDWTSKKGSTAFPVSPRLNKKKN